LKNIKKTETETKKYKYKGVNFEKSGR